MTAQAEIVSDDGMNANFGHMTEIHETAGKNGHFHMTDSGGHVCYEKTRQRRVFRFPIRVSRFSFPVYRATYCSSV